MIQENDEPMREEKSRRTTMPLVWILTLIFLISGFSIDQVSGAEPEPTGPYVTADMIPAEAYDQNVYCPNGSAPTIDGVITEGDGWMKTPRTIEEYNGMTINIRSKHDEDNIYILIETWNCSRPDHIYIEDDGLFPEGTLDDNDDVMYVNYYGFPDGYKDSQGYESMTETQNGGADGSGFDEYFISEWWKPLNSGDEYDMNVTSDEVLGLGIGRTDKAKWPRNYVPTDSSTYGKLHVIFDDYPGNFSLISPANNSHITPGTLIDFAVSGGIESVKYSFDGIIFSDFHDPFLFNTYDWDDDQYRIWLEIHFDSGRSFSRTYYFVVDGSPPVFEGVAAVEPFMNGLGALITWNEATDLTPPVEYMIYLSLDETLLFNIDPVDTTTGTELEIVNLEWGIEYHVGVRAMDGFGFMDHNDISISFTTELKIEPYPGLNTSALPLSEERVEVYAFAGGTPDVDGKEEYIEDRWYETTETVFTRDNERFTITAKHDIDYLYILITSTMTGIDEYRIYINSGENGEIGPFDADRKTIADGEYLVDQYSSADLEYPWYEDRYEGDSIAMSGADSNLSTAEFRIEMLDDTGEDPFIHGNDLLDIAVEIVEGENVHTWPENADLSGNSSTSWGKLYMIFDFLPTEVELISPEAGQIIPGTWDIEITVTGEAKEINYRLDSEHYHDFKGDIHTEDLEHRNHNLTIACKSYFDVWIEFVFSFRVDSAVDAVQGLDYEETSESGIYRIFWDPVEDESSPVVYRVYDLGEREYIFVSDPYIETVNNEITIDLGYLRIGYYSNIAVIAVDSLGNHDYYDRDIVLIERVGNETPDDEDDPEVDLTPPSPFIEYPRVSDPADRSSYEEIRVVSDADTEWVEIYIRQEGEWVLQPGTVWDSWEGVWRVDIDLSDWEGESIDIRVLAGDESGNVGECILEGVPLEQDGDGGVSLASSPEDLLEEMLYVPLIVIAVLFMLAILLIFLIAMIKRDHDFLQSDQMYKRGEGPDTAPKGTPSDNIHGNSEKDGSGIEEIPDKKPDDLGEE